MSYATQEKKKKKKKKKKMKTNNAYAKRQCGMFSYFWSTSNLDTSNEISS